MSEFDDIVDGFDRMDALVSEAALLRSLEDEWRDQRGDGSGSPGEVIAWTLGQLEDYFGPGLFRLFLEATYRQAVVVQPTLDDTPAAPVSVSLRAALETIDYFEKVRR